MANNCENIVCPTLPEIKKQIQIDKGDSWIGSPMYIYTNYREDIHEKAIEHQKINPNRYYLYERVISNIQANIDNTQAIEEENLFNARSYLIQILSLYDKDNTGLFTFEELAEYNAIYETLLLCKNAKKTKYAMDDKTIKRLLKKIDIDKELVKEANLTKKNFILKLRMNKMDEVKQHLKDLTKQEKFDLYILLMKYKYIIEDDFIIINSTDIFRTWFNDELHLYKFVDGRMVDNDVDMKISKMLNKFTIDHYLHLFNPDFIIKDKKWTDEILEVTNEYVPKLNTTYIGRQNDKVNDELADMLKEVDTVRFNAIKTRVRELMEEMFDTDSLVRIKDYFMIPKVKVDTKYNAPTELSDNKIYNPLLMKIVQFYYEKKKKIPDISTDISTEMKLTTREYAKLQTIIKTVLKKRNKDAKYNQMIDKKEFFVLPDKTKAKTKNLEVVKMTAYNIDESKTPSEIVNGKNKNTLAVVDENKKKDLDYNSVYDVMNISKEYIREISAEIVIDLFDLIKAVNVIKPSKVLDGTINKDNPLNNSMTKNNYTSEHGSGIDAIMNPKDMSLSEFKNNIYNTEFKPDMTPEEYHEENAKVNGFFSNVMSGVWNDISSDLDTVADNFKRGEDAYSGLSLIDNGGLPLPNGMTLDPFMHKVIRSTVQNIASNIPQLSGHEKLISDGLTIGENLLRLSQTGDWRSDEYKRSKATKVQYNSTYKQNYGLQNNEYTSTTPLVSNYSELLRNQLDEKQNNYFKNYATMTPKQRKAEKAKLDSLENNYRLSLANSDKNYFNGVYGDATLNGMAVGKLSLAGYNLTGTGMYDVDMQKHKYAEYSEIRNDVIYNSDRIMEKSREQQVIEAILNREVNTDYDALYHLKNDQYYKDNFVNWVNGGYHRLADPLKDKINAGYDSFISKADDVVYGSLDKAQSFVHSGISYAQSGIEYIKDKRDRFLSIGNELANKVAPLASAAGALTKFIGGDSKASSLLEQAGNFLGGDNPISSLFGLGGGAGGSAARDKSLKEIYDQSYLKYGFNTVQINGKELDNVLVEDYYEELDYLHSDRAKRYITLKIMNTDNNPFDDFPAKGAQITLQRVYSLSRYEYDRYKSLTPDNHNVFDWEIFDDIQIVYTAKVKKKDIIKKNRNQLTEEERKVLNPSGETVVFTRAELEIVPIMFSKDANLPPTDNPTVSYLPVEPPKSGGILGGILGGALGNTPLGGMLSKVNAGGLIGKLRDGGLGSLSMQDVVTGIALGKQVFDTGKEAFEGFKQAFSDVKSLGTEIIDDMGNAFSSKDSIPSEVDTDNQDNKVEQPTYDYDVTPVYDECHNPCTISAALNRYTNMVTNNNDMNGYAGYIGKMPTNVKGLPICASDVNTTISAY